MGKDRNEYQQWILENESPQEVGQAGGRMSAWRYQPLFSIFLFVEGVAWIRKRACQKSIKKQSYPKWEVITVAGSNGENVWAQAHGDYVLFMSANDLLAVNALEEMAEKLNEGVEYDFIYSDEDVVSVNGKERSLPFFKPDWSPDLFWCMRYTGQLGVYRRELAKKAYDKMMEERKHFGLDSLEVEKCVAAGNAGAAVSLAESWQYDFLLHFLELTKEERIGHIRKALYHVRNMEKGYPEEVERQTHYGEVDREQELVRQVKERALARRGILGSLELVPDMGQWRVVYECQKQPLVSIIIPSKDNVKILEQCLKSIEAVTSYGNYEIVLVDNGSGEENRAHVEALAAKKGFCYHYEPMEFNFSRMCNLGALRAKGEFLLFLNDDIEVTQQDWLERLVGQAMQSHCGAVGAKLLYPDCGQIQHAGVANMKMGPSHYLTGQSDDAVYYFGRNRLDYDCLAVTGACLLVSRQKFEEAGGFSEELAITYNDVDLCFKLYEAGYYNVIRNDVCLYHHESVSRGIDTYNVEKTERLIRERERMWERHPATAMGDPFYSEHLAQDKTDFRLQVKGNSLEVSKRMGILENASRYEEPVMVTIDGVIPDTEMLIKGWCYWEGNNEIRYKKTYVALKDNQGRCVYYDTCPQEREDVAKALKIEKEDCGFSCRIPYGELDGKGYQIGILIETTKRGVWKLQWSDRRIEGC